ncbi:MAG TPA: hypothetical protein VH436_29205 [Vicinamibacterales bacterium]|jgi:hypothetical protein
MTRFLVTLALSGSLLSAIGDVLHLLESLREPAPALVKAMTMILDSTWTVPAWAAQENER